MPSNDIKSIYNLSRLKKAKHFKLVQSKLLVLHGYMSSFKDFDRSISALGDSLFRVYYYLKDRDILVSTAIDVNTEDIEISVHTPGYGSQTFYTQPDVVDYLKQHVEKT